MPYTSAATKQSTTAPLDARRAIRGGIFGNYVDQFDIFLPVIALAPAAAHLFGPENLVGNAGLIFIATLIGRPLGAAVFGPIADRVGRAATTQIALIGIAVTTLLIAVIPGHSMLGTGTLLAIVALRFIGGVFLGGEYSSAIPLAMEWSEPKRRGMVSGLIMWTSPWANASIAALVLVLLNVLGEDEYNAWGWRVPFVLGSFLAFSMLGYYRSHVADSPIWKQSTKRANPLKDILVGDHRRALWQVFLLMSGLWLFTYMAIPTLTSELALGGLLDAKTISFTMMCATAASAVAMAGCGQLSTVTGRRTFFIGFGLVGAVLAPLAFLGVFSAESPVASYCWWWPFKLLRCPVTVPWAPTSQNASRLPCGPADTALATACPSCCPRFTPTTSHHCRTCWAVPRQSQSCSSSPGSW